MLKPLLACTIDISEIDSLVDDNYIVQPKYDGIRCIIEGGTAYSRKAKPLPNKHLQELVKDIKGTYDCELMHKSMDFNIVQSIIMSQNTLLNNIYIVVFTQLEDGKQVPITLPSDLFKEVESIVAHKADIPRLYTDFLAQGFEGVMLRSLTNNTYKQGRSTLKEGLLIKIKPFSDIEVIIRDFTPHEKLSDTLGAFIVELNGKTFNVGGGFTIIKRREFWQRREEIRNKQMSITYQEISKYGIPRFPIFKCFREDI